MANGAVDWTKGVRPWTFFENGVVGHVSMAEPFDALLSRTVAEALKQDGVLEGEEQREGSKPRVHTQATVVCIEGPQFATRQESLLFRGFKTEPEVSVINMSAVPECKLFKEAEMAYALVCMSTDYDSWHESEEGVSVAMVMQHMKWNSGNAKRAVEAILGELGKEGVEGKVGGARLEGSVRGGVMGLGTHVADDGGRGQEAVERLRWLFGDKWVGGG